MRAVAAVFWVMPIAHRFSVALTGGPAPRLFARGRQRRRLLEGMTLARWAAAGGFARDEVMAGGDNLNDVEMLEFAGTAVVMGNASAAVQTRGFHLTASNDDDGLADAIRRFVLDR